MKVLKFDRKGMGKWLARLGEKGNVYVPASSKEGKTAIGWRKLESAEMPPVSPGVPARPVKNFLLPQPEVLFRFSTRPGKEDSFIPREPEPGQVDNIIFGVRPCDARSIMLNAMPYENDPYYQARMEHNIIIGLTCGEPCSTCFCSWTGGSPMGTDGCDLSVIELEGAFMARAITRRGEKLLEEAAGIAVEADHDAVEGLEKMSATAVAGAGSGTAPERALRERDLMELYNAPFWQDLAERCINCGACTFLCPTCYCFDIQDETLHGKGRRIRYQDSCMFPLFTLHASGHNPRGQKVQRVRNRFMHKLKYFPDRFGPLSCVGCGRCVRDCPVNIDIREVMGKLLAL